METQRIEGNRAISLTNARMLELKAVYRRCISEYTFNDIVVGDTRISQGISQNENAKCTKNTKSNAQQTAHRID